MGWQDDPVVKAPPAWTTDPVVGDTAAPEDNGALHAFLTHGAQGALLNRGDELAGWVADKLGLGGERIRPGPSAPAELREQLESAPSAGQNLRDHLRQDEETAARQHGVASLAGSVVGGTAAALAGGSALSAAGKAIPAVSQAAKAFAALSPVQKALVAGGALGGAYASGGSKADPLKGDAARYAADTALGVGWGATLGVAGHHAAPYVGKAAGWAGQKLDDAASNFALKSAGFIQKDLKNLRGGEAQALRIGRDLRSTGAVAPFRSVRGVETKTAALRDEQGRLIGGLVDDADALASSADLPSGASVADRIRTNVARPAEALPPMATHVPGIESAAQAYAAHGEEPVSLATLHAWKKAQGKVANWTSDALPQELKRDIYGELKSELSESVTDIGNRHGAPELGEQFSNANRLYSSLKPAADRAREGVAREVGNQQVGLKDAMAASAGMMTGGPVGAVVLGAGSRLARQYGASVAGPVAAGAGKSLTALKAALQSNPQAFGKYAGALTSAAERGDDALSVANYVLAQRDPEYRKIQEQLASGK